MKKLHKSRMNQRDPLLDSVKTTFAGKGKTKDVFCFKLVFLRARHSIVFSFILLLNDFESNLYSTSNSILGKDYNRKK